MSKRWIALLLALLLMLCPVTATAATGEAANPEIQESLPAENGGLFGVDSDGDIIQDATVDNSVLLQVLTFIESYDAADYTAQTFAPLDALYQQYRPIAADMPTQEAVDNAVFALLEAMSALHAYLTLSVNCDTPGAEISVSFSNTAGGCGDYTVEYGTPVTLTATAPEGTFFAGWLETGSRRILCDSDAFTFPMSVNASYKPIFIDTAKSLLLFVSYAGQIISMIEKTPEEWQTIADLDAFCPPVPYRYGFENGRWDFSGDELAALQSGDIVSVEPEYDAVATEIPYGDVSNDGMLHLKMHFRYDAENAVGSFIMNTLRPDDFTVQSIGMLFYYDAASRFDPTTFDVNINNKMQVSQYDYLGEDTYITNMKKFRANRNWAVRGYATYYKDGQLKTIYSNQVNVIRNEDIHQTVTAPGIAPTCTEDGYSASVVCDICGKVFRYSDPIPALGHTYEREMLPPTCTENGAYVDTCTRCGDSVTIHPTYDESTGTYDYPELAATGHHYDEVTVTTPATLQEIGECEADCSVCGEHAVMPSYIAHGSCGDSVSYAFDHRTGTLTISGEGAMNDYALPTDSPFNALTNIRHVVIGEGVTHIANSAFYRCAALESVSIANSVTSIGNRAFYQCAALMEITLPASVRSIDYYAFYGCSALTALTLNEGLQSIAQYAFASCTALTSFTIPQSVTSIGNAAFTGCTSLASVTLPSTVTEMGRSVFSNCTGLTTVVLAEGMTTVRESTFSECTSLTEVTLPGTLTLIENNAFFHCVSLTDITFPPRLNYIAENAFYGCSALGNLTLPDSIRYIERKAFTNCTSLNTALPAGLSSLGSSAFKNCTQLTAVTIPAGLTSIPDSAFMGCTALTTLTLPDTVTNISRNAFSGCSALVSLMIPHSVQSIGANAFSGCNGLQSITVDGANTVYDSRNQCNALIETASNTVLLGCCNTVIPSGITTIGARAFSGITGMTALPLPESVTAIGDYAFSGCTDLQTVALPAGVTTLGKYCFENCTSLHPVALPVGITTISEGLFYGCTSFTAYTVGANITSIGSKAFYGCTALTAVTLPDTVESVDTYAFYGCTALTDVTLSAAMEKISAYTFSECTALAHITLPDGIRSIASRAFNNCSALQEITLPTNVTSLGTYAFNGCTAMTDITIRNLGCNIVANAHTIPENAVIHGYLMSTAKDYADQFGRSFASLNS